MSIKTELTSEVQNAIGCSGRALTKSAELPAGPLQIAIMEPVAESVAALNVALARTNELPGDAPPSTAIATLTIVSPLEGGHVHSLDRFDMLVTFRVTGNASHLHWQRISSFIPSDPVRILTDTEVAAGTFTIDKSLIFGVGEKGVLPNVFRFYLTDDQHAAIPGTEVILTVEVHSTNLVVGTTPPVDDEPHDHPDEPHDHPVGLPLEHHHLPDFSQDPLAIVLGPGEEMVIDYRLEFTTIVDTPTSKLTLRPGCELIKVNKPVDVWDPDQFGHGMVLHGELDAVGSPCRPFSRATAGIPAGVNQVTLADSPDGWGVGDEMLICESRQRLFRKNPDFCHSERVTITAIDGSRVEFTPATANVHPMREEGETPHVALLNRDVKIRSASPDNPGHLMLEHGSKANIQDCEFSNFGRTRIDRWDLTTFFEDGTVDHLAENRRGRYAIYCCGADGHQVEISNNVIRDSRRWAIAVHDTNHATIEGNVVVGADGAGIVCEDSTVHSTRIIDNLECDILSSRSDKRGGAKGGGRRSPPHLPMDKGFIGSGVWCNNRANFIDGNVAANCGDGTTITGYSEENWREFAIEFPEMSNNEAYACATHTWCVHPQGHPPGGNRLQDVHNGMVGWHLMKNALEFYHTNNTLIKNAVFHNDPRVSELAAGNWRWTSGGVGVALDLGHANYRNGGMMVENTIITGWNVGIFVPAVCSPEDWFRVNGGVLQNFLNVLLTPARKFDRVATFDGVDFQPSDIKPLESLVRYYNDHPNIPQHYYDVFGIEEGDKFTDDPLESQIRKSPLTLIGYRNAPVKIFIDGDPNASCTERDEKIYGFVCEELA